MSRGDDNLVGESDPNARTGLARPELSDPPRRPEHPVFTGFWPLRERARRAGTRLATLWSVTRLVRTRPRAPTRPRASLSRWGLSLLAGAAACVLSCATVDLPELAPAPRGITVPLPPPSFAEASEITVDVEGQSYTEVADGSFVILYDAILENGYLEYLDPDGGFLFEQVPVSLPSNCFQLSGYDGAEDGFGSVGFWKVEVRSAEACADTLCSQMDAQGDCACLYEYPAGC